MKRHSIVVAALVIILFAVSAFARERTATFAWDPPPDAEFTGMYLKYSASPDLSNPVVKDVGHTIDSDSDDDKITFPDDSKTYYVFVTAYVELQSGVRLESGTTNVVIVAPTPPPPAPPAAPKNLRLVP